MIAPLHVELTVPPGLILAERIESPELGLNLTYRVDPTRPFAFIRVWAPRGPESTGKLLTVRALRVDRHGVIKL